MIENGPSSLVLSSHHNSKLATASKNSLAGMWREIQGSNNWKGLLEPLNPILKNEIIRYGEFVMACYHAFDLDPSSKRYCNCKYGRNRILEEVGLESSGYEITKYIYATPDISIPLQDASCSSRWIGYVAVSTGKEIKRLGRRDILISFRGTVTSFEWVANFMSALTPARLDPHEPRLDVMVELGFLSLYTSTDRSCKFGHRSCRDQLLAEVSRIINKYRGEEVSITVAGHSMGSSLAMLLAYDIAELGLNRIGPKQEIPITVYSFAGPRVGNSGFKRRCEELGLKVLRVVNVNDPVTKVPGVFLNENFRVLGERGELPWCHSCYIHVGVELALNFFKMRNPACVHDLEAYLGLLKCPKKVAKKSGDFFTKAKQFIRKQNFDSWQWRSAAKRLGKLIQLPTRICKT
ncbi:phospholipase A1-Ialpha2, chloroplastic-like [Nymphaea colorata]|uniref:Fungal lipase-type domain-containing protein n=1 Tax=Nymphaea colorata TaxID=210225 RepID=A0A5K1B372_9MAGN|nr:phospholipase A1-Ialpha2, chloroplastic-like [Nymphaea colorata]